MNTVTDESTITYPNGEPQKIRDLYDEKQVDR